MAKVRYIGPHTEGVFVSYITDAVEHYVMPGEVVELDDRLVHGTPAVTETVELEDGTIVEEIVDHGIAGLLEHGLDADGNGAPHWELVDGRKSRAQTDAGNAGETETE